MTLTARPTVYRGIQMRSRLEATFAGFLDEAGFDWSYEPRAYGAGRAQYLPDFEVTFNGIDPIYVEVKGQRALDMGVFRRMEVILASEPTARLLLIEAERFAQGFYDVALRDLRYPGSNGLGWVKARFAACSCGSIYVTPVHMRRGTIPIGKERCAQCTDGDVVAWLNPTGRIA